MNELMRIGVDLAKRVASTETSEQSRKVTPMQCDCSNCAASAR